MRFIGSGFRLELRGICFYRLDKGRIEHERHHFFRRLPFERGQLWRSAALSRRR